MEASAAPLHSGAGAHAEHEHILISSLEPRAKLLLRLLETLE